MESPFPKPPFWYDNENLDTPEIPEKVVAFGMEIETEYKEIMLEDFGVPKKYQEGTKDELKGLLIELHQTLLNLFQNLSYDNIYAKKDAQEMLIILQNMHHLINSKFVKNQAKENLVLVQQFFQQRAEEFDKIFSQTNSE
eukprot:NODE_328_length_9539_cov_0.346716.p7 type:complete len:140 gc:universal NODE_328_length_9539_cov_0.346716:793-374(-)